MKLKTGHFDASTINHNKGPKGRECSVKLTRKGLRNRFRNLRREHVSDHGGNLEDPKILARAAEAALVRWPSFKGWLATASAL